MWISHIDNDEEYLRSLFTSLRRKRREGNFAAEIPRFSNWRYRRCRNAGNSYRNLHLFPPPLYNCGRILHKRHVGAPGSARTHVLSMTKSREREWHGFFRFSASYVGRLRKRESDFLEGVTGFPERTKGIHFRSASDRISLPFPLLTSRRIDRAAL